MQFGTKVFATSVLSIGILATLGSQVIAQGDFFMKSRQALKEGNRLLAIDVLRKGFEKDPSMQSVMTQYLPLISDYLPTNSYDEVITMPTRNQKYVQQLRESIGAVERLEALKAIVELARDQQIVILNEAHDCPQHRAFGLLLAFKLRKIGFDFMAMETLVGPSREAGRVEFDYPTLDTGYYSGEPVFGDFVRQTAQLGYQMIAYEISPSQRTVNAQENPIESIREREDAQSNNLIEHVINKHPDAKIFIYVGYSHATEDWQTMENGSQLGWMAAQIKRKTGIDPLTIDQVGGSYNPKGNQIDPVFQLVESSKSIQSPILLRDKVGAWLSSDSYYRKTDLTVFHPIQALIDGRPNWLRMSGYRRPFVISNEDYFVEPTTLVQAFLSEEGEGAIPMDQLLLDSADGTSTFLLPKGKYRIEIRTLAGDVKRGPEFEIAHN